MYLFFYFYLIVKTVFISTYQINRCKNPSKKIKAAIEDGSIDVKFNSNLVSIGPKSVLINFSETDESHEFETDLVYIFAGGELPTKFLQDAGIKVAKRFGHILKKHK